MIHTLLDLTAGHISNAPDVKAFTAGETADSFRDFVPEVRFY